MGFLLQLDGVAHDIEILARRPHLRLRLNGRDYEVTAPGSEGDGAQQIEIGGRSHGFVRADLGDRQVLRMAGRTFEATLRDPRDATGAGGAELDCVRAPMPCSVVEVHKRAGEAVARGEALVTVESMKLQIALLAPRDGRLARAPEGAGETFEKDAVVVELEPRDGV
ncbi:MAG TPA: biotin/lipoyl-containing protein [Roseiarcus sp.]|nr:biotin/lipoyl-containing protein [Roseiarcus sp.]